MRGQLFVLDLLFALLIGVVAIGILSQASESAQRSAFDNALIGDRHAAAIAQWLVENETGTLVASFVPRGLWCVQHSPAQSGDSCSSSSTQAAFANCATIHASRRVVLCGAAPCLLEVKTCG